jgi:hypothetical protein
MLRFLGKTKHIVDERTINGHAANLDQEMRGLGDVLRALGAWVVSAPPISRPLLFILLVLDLREHIVLQIQG